MSFWKTLFGGRGGEAEGGAKVGEPVDYNGFILRAAPFQEGGRFQTAGIIEKEIGGVRKQHRFIRADSHASYDAAVEFTLVKARQIVDQMGEHLFE